MKTNIILFFCIAMSAHLNCSDQDLQLPFDLNPEDNTISQEIALPNTSSNDYISPQTLYDPKSLTANRSPENLSRCNYPQSASVQKKRRFSHPNHPPEFLQSINTQLQAINDQDKAFQKGLVTKILEEMKDEDYSVKRARIDQTLSEYQALQSHRPATIVLLDDQLDQIFIATLTPELQDTYENMKLHLSIKQSQTTMPPVEQSLSVTDFNDIAEMLSRPSPVPK